MVEDLFKHALVPVANRTDAEATLDSLLPYIPDGGRFTLVHVIEKAGGAPDKASMEQREALASELFEMARERCDAAGVTCDTELAYGTDVPKAVFDVADDIDASAIAFVPREGSRLVRWLTGDTALDFITKAERPVIALHGGDDE
jgi:hypothetical protein